MNCWKCGSNENLSIKARHRDGSVRIMMCRDCRKKEWRINNEKRIAKLKLEEKMRPQTPERKAWDNLALRNQQSILSKYS